MDELTLWMLVFAAGAILAGLVRIATDGARRGMLVTSKESAVYKKRRFCEQEIGKTRERIEELERSIKQRSREVKTLQKEVEQAAQELQETEARIQKRNPTRHKVPAIS